MPIQPSGRLAPIGEADQAVEVKETCRAEAGPVAVKPPAPSSWRSRSYDLPWRGRSERRRDGPVPTESPVRSRGRDELVAILRRTAVHLALAEAEAAAPRDIVIGAGGSGQGARNRESSGQKEQDRARTGDAKRATGGHCSSHRKPDVAVVQLDAAYLPSFSTVSSAPVWPAWVRALSACPGPADRRSACRRWR